MIIFRIPFLKRSLKLKSRTFDRLKYAIITESIAFNSIAKLAPIIPCSTVKKYNKGARKIKNFAP